MVELLVVSLADAAARREDVRKQLAASGLPWSFVDAVHGAKLPAPAPEYDRRRRLRLYGYEMMPGEIGCFLSHRKVWQHVATSGRPALVLEDDFILLTPAAELAALLAQLVADEQLQLVRLAAVFDRPTVPLRRLGERQLVAYRRDPAGTAAYLVKPEAARRLLGKSARFCSAVDDYLYFEHLHGVASPGVMPYPIGTRDVPSTIQGRNSHRLSLRQKLRREFFRAPQGLARWAFRLRKRIAP